MSGGEGEGRAVALVFFADTVVHTYLEDNKISPIINNDIMLFINYFLIKNKYKYIYFSPLTWWVPVLVKHSLSAKEPSLGRKPQDRWTRVTPITGDTEYRIQNTEYR